MKRFFYLLIFIFIFSNSVWALSLLPRTSYLQYKDNQKEVLILQQILNSDPDTQIASDGPGSPGNENWYFGILTEKAVEKFQQKYNLQVTGKVNFKTLRQLNFVAQNTSQENSTITDTNLPTPQLQIQQDKTQTNPTNSDNSQNPYLDNSATNPYLDTPTNQNASPTQKTFLDNTIVGTLISKLQNLFSGNISNSNNQNLNQTPQCNYTSAGVLVTTDPNGNTVNTSGCAQTTNFSQNNNAYGYSQQNPYSSQYGANSRYSNLPFGGGGPQNTYQPGQIFGSSPLSISPASQRELDLLNGPSCSAIEGGVSATLVGGGQGGGCGKGSNFGNNLNGTNDSEDNGKGCGNYNTRIGQNGQEGIALPPNIQIAMFGSLRAACGGWVEVTDVRNGKCQTFRIVDTGPAAYTGRVIDLTGVAEKKIGGQTDDRYCFRKAANQNPQTGSN